MKHGPGRMVTEGRFKLQAEVPSSKREVPSAKVQAPSLSYKLKSFLNLNPISRGPGLMAHGQ